MSARVTTRQQRQAQMIGHGALAIILGLFSGFFLLWAALGEVMVWPFPSSGMQVPGSHGGWRAAHTGPIMNGLLCIAFALVLPYVDLDDSSERRASLGMIFTVWANAAFYIFGLFGTNRGLSVGSEKFGPGNIFDFLAYAPAAIAGFVTIAVAVMIARAAFARARS